jgi:membrane-bound ClpP family serine protease
MTVWYSNQGNQKVGWQAKAVLALGLLAVLLVTAVPVALLVGLILMLLGHVLVGLALFGASILAALGGVAVAVFGGAQYLRRLVRAQRDRVVQLRQGDYQFD